MHHMRGHGNRGLALVTVLATLVSVLLGVGRDRAEGVCRFRGACALRLPAPITVASGRIGYRIARDGRARRVAATSGPYPPGATWFPSTGTWFEVRRRRLVVGRGRRTLWRSYQKIAANQLGVIAAGPRAVAFQHDHLLYIAAYGGAEHPVAPRELPLGWSDSELYSYSYPQHRLLLRAATGRLIRPLGPPRPVQYQLDPQTESLYFIAAGQLVGAHGKRTWRLGSLHDYGMSVNTSMVALGGLIELQDNRRLVVLRPNGTLFASTQLPRDHHQPDSPSSQLQIAPHASAVAFTVAFGRSDNPTTTRRAHGTEIVYVLRAGADTATRLDVERVAFAACERGAGLQWRGSWLLYSNTERNLAAIDTANPRRTIELSAFIRGSLRNGRGIDAAWGR